MENDSKRYDEGWKRIFMKSVVYSFDFNNRWPMLTGMSNSCPKESVSILKDVNRQDSTVHDVGGYVNADDLQDYCWINNFTVGGYIQGFSRKSVVLNKTEIDFVNAVVSCIEEQFQAMNPTQIDSGKKPKTLPQGLPIRGSIEIWYDHITESLRSHISYLLVDDVLNYIYHKELFSMLDTQFPWTEKWLVAITVIETDIEMEKSKEACLIHYICVRKQ